MNSWGRTAFLFATRLIYIERIQEQNSTTSDPSLPTATQVDRTVGFAAYQQHRAREIAIIVRSNHFSTS
jgi:hypothetical protein